jgi:hypothetical protein
MNSVLQCMAHVPPVAALALSGRLHGVECVMAGSKPCACCILQAQLAAQLRGGTGGSVRPGAMLGNLGLFSRSFWWVVAYKLVGF